ncbi:unnamed protein product [Lactuca saligna]|uniref:Uncharacterized protein n=1 Tax=Lactuca saligna TaxID=75948 RepID=A0AA36EPI4_LACSI|nr:unnamed protein product [Lactuca saligna]
MDVKSENVEEKVKVEEENVVAAKVTVNPDTKLQVEEKKENKKVDTNKKKEAPVTINKELLQNGKAILKGMILLWDVDVGLAQIDKYFHSNDNHVIAGALLGVGVVNCGIKNDCDPASAIFVDYLDKENASIRIGAITGLGLAYAGSQLLKGLEKIVASADIPMLVCGDFNSVPGREIMQAVRFSPAFQ